MHIVVKTDIGIFALFWFELFLQGNELKLADMFFNPEKLHEPGMIDDLIRGMSTTSMETLDQFITDEVTNHLFEDKATPYSGLGEEHNFDFTKFLLLYKKKK